MICARKLAVIHAEQADYLEGNAPHGQQGAERDAGADKAEGEGIVSDPFFQVGTDDFKGEGFLEVSCGGKAGQNP